MFLGETQHLSGNNGALWWSQWKQWSIMVEHFSG